MVIYRKQIQVIREITVWFFEFPPPHFMPGIFVEPPPSKKKGGEVNRNPKTRQEAMDLCSLQLHNTGLDRFSVDHGMLFSLVFSAPRFPNQGTKWGFFWKIRINLDDFFFKNDLQIRNSWVSKSSHFHGKLFCARKSIFLFTCVPNVKNKLGLYWVLSPNPGLKKNVKFHWNSLQPYIATPLDDLFWPEKTSPRTPIFDPSQHT